jgi:hypothetical protein
MKTLSEMKRRKTKVRKVKNTWQKALSVAYYRYRTLPF